MKRIMTTKSANSSLTKPSSNQDRVCCAPSKSPPPFPARIYTREYEWDSEFSQGIFSKFNHDFEDLHGASIGEVPIDLFKQSFATWMQNFVPRATRVEI